MTPQDPASAADAFGHDSQTSTPLGLTTAEARRRLAEYGPNAVAETAPLSWQVYIGKFRAPVPWMLEAAIMLQAVLGAYVEAAVIAALLVFNVTLGFVQESRATAALAALRNRLAPTALIMRDGAWRRLAATEVVPGDTIRLALGALVPADARIVSGAVLVDQSMLSGESVPVDANPGNVVYAGALVRRGQAVAEVTATGANTGFGRTAGLVRDAHAASTEQKAIFGVIRKLAAVNGAVGVLIILYAYILALPLSDLVRLALTTLLATIPVALPATFTLSAALSARKLARDGVLLTRLSAAHEAAAMDVLCADKTGTLTENALTVVAVQPLAEADRDRILVLAALASSEADQDPIDAAIRRAAEASGQKARERLVRFVPFDPATRTAEAFVLDHDGNALRITKGAFAALAGMAEIPAQARSLVDSLAGQGHRVIAVAMGPSSSLRLIGLIAISDPPRADSARLVSDLRDIGVRTVMVTGDAPLTAAAIARKVGIAGEICPPGRMADDSGTEVFDVFARIVPEEKYRLVRALQAHGHVVGMCGDGTNDAPALRQAQIGIAVSSATEVAKAAAGMVMTQPGLAGIVIAVREGRIGFQRLLTYTFNMLIKKTEIVLFLAFGLALTGHAIMTPALMVLMLITNDFLAMSLTTDRAGFAPTPSVWRMSGITAAGIVLGVCKLGFSVAVLALGKFRLGLESAELQTLAFVTLVFGSQGVLYVVRERRRLWSSRPGAWVLAASAADLAIVSMLALTGTLMAPLPWQLLVEVFAGIMVFALVLDQIKRPVMAIFRIV